MTALLTGNDTLTVLAWLTLTFPVTLLAMAAAGAVVRWLLDGPDRYEITTHQTPAAVPREERAPATYTSRATGAAFIDDVLEGRWA